jgi:hypothetical protein
MKKFLLGTALAGSMVLAAAPAGATILLPGSQDIVFTDFALVAGTQGTHLETMVSSGNALPLSPFAGTLRSAVYRNTAGFLDFYYQVVHNNADPIDELSVAPFGGWIVDAYYWDADSDGAGVFTAENNGGLTVAQSTAERSNDGNVLRVAFSFPADPILGLPSIQDPVGPGETSSTYIFRTNATMYGPGTAGIQDGVAFFVPTFAPVPEPATWAMMLAGFGAVGYSLRRKKAYRLQQAV